MSSVRLESLAAEAGIEPGDTVVEIDGHALRDVIDYQYFQAEPLITVAVTKTNGVVDLIEFEKDTDEDLGLGFEHATWDGMRLCNNNCFFCFLKGLPKGMRGSLYLKDDDYRLSFLHGNFVTLTNLTEDDWARLAEQRISPLNVSVHATEHELRSRMLSNKNPPPVLEQISRLGSLGIEVHTQIVLCPGVNDGDNLDRSISDLSALFPTVQSIAVVPVGASPKLEDWSSTRSGIELASQTMTSARQLVGQIRAHQKANRKEHGATIVHCSDEFYLTARENPPGAAAYEGFPQYENGLGMVRTLVDDWGRTKRKVKAKATKLQGLRVTLAAGTLIGPKLKEMAAEFGTLSGADISVAPVVNTVFGDRVNVSGLICGEDYLNALEGQTPDFFILPRASLDYFGEKFLDSLTVEEVGVALGAPVAFASQWSEVLSILTEGPSTPHKNDLTNGIIWSEARQDGPAAPAGMLESRDAESKS